ncbi:MAG: sodium:calcium exchanger [Firmicutes bacterium HGW-Firmicutes-14]|nr:MAG: sodium:calcium exchanger [Firmicutes bacterium HGW-Firmicutes-14]
MGRHGKILVSCLISIASVFIASLIGNPIRPIHQVLISVAFISGFIALVLYFGWLEKTEERIWMAIVFSLTVLFVTLKHYLF